MALSQSIKSDDSIATGQYRKRLEDLDALDRQWKLPRVSHDADQIVGVRATRFLQLPYAATALLMTISVALHWLTSQAFAIIGGVTKYTDANLIWSPIALLIIGFIAFMMLLGSSIYYMFQSVRQCL